MTLPLSHIDPCFKSQTAEWSNKSLLCIFDLDGTLIDSKQDLVISVNAALESVGRSPLPPERISSYVGDGAAMLIKRALGQEADGLQAQTLQFFLKYYREHALQHTRLYPGIPEALEKLSRDGHSLAVLTNKPFRISRDILRSLDVMRFFTGVLGGDSLPQKKPDPAGIYQFMTETGWGLEDTLMIGDSGVDVQTARNAKVRCCGVFWGFQPETLEANPPDIAVQDPSQLHSALTARS